MPLVGCGEEFAMYLANTSESEGVVICERIRKAIESADYSDIASNVQPTLSIGMACRIGQEGHSTMLIHADKALYQAKEDKVGTVCVSFAIKQTRQQCARVSHCLPRANYLSMQQT